MRILVSGSREYADSERFDQVIREHIGDTPLDQVTIVSGGAKGLDRIAERWAERNGVDCEVHPADWERYDRGAGGIRNQNMVDSGADVLLAFPLGRSPGTRDCISRARRHKIRVIVTDPDLGPESIVDPEPLFDWG